jgi:hypothetical protein
VFGSNLLRLAAPLLAGALIGLAVGGCSGQKATSVEAAKTVENAGSVGLNLTLSSG